MLRPIFVDSVPNASIMEPDSLYVSIEYATVIHKCACGCENETITPLAPDEWSLIYDGETVSLTPSIGNWGLQCKSHYWVQQNRIIWVIQKERRLLPSSWRMVHAASWRSSCASRIPRTIVSLSHALRTMATRLRLRIRRD